MKNGPTVRQTFDMLAREGLIAAESSIEHVQAHAGEVQPWYLRAMVGFGAWIASLLLIAFITGISFGATDGGFLVLGLLFMTGSAAMRHRHDTDFTNQAALAGSLAGIGLVIFGLADLGWDFEYLLIALIVINAVLVAAYPDKTHRFLSVVTIIGSLTVLLYVWEISFLVPFMGPLLAGLLVLALDKEHVLVSGGWYLAYTPIGAGLMLSAFGCLMLSTLYVLPELTNGFSFYPRPWISSVLLGALLLHVEGRILRSTLDEDDALPTAVVYGLTVIFIVIALAAPGLILALLIVAAANLHGNSLYRAAGIIFLAIFGAAYFYGIEIGMLAKSVTLIGVGSLLLVCRWLLVRTLGSTHGERHA